ncbi:MAG: hypothetical protein ACJAYU_002618 [Bradymonadia bacterium]|jgi:hypothetical protein
MNNSRMSRTVAPILAASLVLLATCGESKEAVDAGTDTVADADVTANVDVSSDVEDVADAEPDADIGSDTEVDVSTELCQGEGATAALFDSEDAIAGPRAQGRPGDFELRNPHARFVIQQPTDKIGIVSQTGGTLIDADVVRADGTTNDVFGELGTLINVAGGLSAESVEIVSAGGPGEDAVVVSRGTYDLNGFIITDVAIESVAGFNPFEGNVDPDTLWPLDVEIRYTLPACGAALRVEVTGTNTAEVDTPWVMAWMTQGGLVDPFVPGIGFVNDIFGTADTVFFESNAAGIDVTYGLVPDVRDPSRALLGFNGALVSLHDISLLDLLSFPGGTPVLAPGESATAGAWLIVGNNAVDAIATFGDLTSDDSCAPWLGRIEEKETGAPLSGVHVATLEVRNGEPSARTTTNAATNADGEFSLCLPPGPAALIFGQDGRPYVDGLATPTPITIEVPQRLDAPDEPDGTFVLPQTTRLRLNVTDADGTPIPSRLSVLGIDTSAPDRRLDGDGFDPLPPGVVQMDDTADGTFDLFVEPGPVDIVVTRGIEWSLHRQEIDLQPGDDITLDVTLHHVVDTDGFLSGDFHVHAAPGPDSTITYERRVTNMAAEGVDVIVATDHAFITDYQPTIAALGLSAEVTSLPGQEITTFASGHFGGFPLQPDESPNGGAINWVGLDPVAIAEEVHRRDANAIFQIMHPRAIPAPGGGNYFSLIDLVFDADGPLAGPNALDPLDVRLTEDARWLDPSFNAMEIVTFANVQGLSDWMNLLNAGWRLTATGNSDTHTRWVEGSGYARNLVYVGPDNDTVDTFDAERFVAGVRDGRNVVSLGIFADVTVNPDTAAALIGDTVDVSEIGTATVRVRVQTGTWMRAEHVAIYFNGAVVAELEAPAEEVPSSDGGVRHEAFVEVVIDVPADGWVAAVVTSDEALYPLLPYNSASRSGVTIEEIRANTLPGTISPIAVTNPVWLDADGDGAITPSRTIVPQDCQIYPRIDRSNPYVSVPETNCGCVREGGAPGCE